MKNMTYVSHNEMQRCGQLNKPKKNNKKKNTSKHTPDQISMVLNQTGGKNHPQ